MAQLDDIVNIVISRASATVSRASFSLPLIAAFHNHWLDRVRTYSANTMLATMLTEGFTENDVAYKIAQVMLSQSPRPSKIKIGRLDTSWTRKVTIVPTVASSKVFAGRVNDQPWTFTSDVDATAAEIATGIQTAITALAGVTATVVGTNVEITADSAATTFNVSNTGAGGFSFSDTSTASNLATELGLIRAADANWYGFVIDQVSEAAINAAAAWAETDVCIFSASSADSGIVDPANTTDIASDIKASGYARTGVWVHEDADAFLGAGILALILPYDPGSANWAHKSVRGVPVSNWTATQAAAALAKNANIMLSVAGLNDTQWGKSGSGDFLDNQQGEDWIRETMQEDVYAFLHGSAKIPYTDRSVARLKGVIEGVLLRGIERGVISPDVPYTIDAPLVEDVSPVDRANRVLPDVIFSCQLSGAINTVDPLLGLVSV